MRTHKECGFAGLRLSENKAPWHSCKKELTEFTGELRKTALTKRYINDSAISSIDVRL